MNTNGHTKACMNTAVVTFGTAITTNASSIAELEWLEHMLSFY